MSNIKQLFNKNKKIILQYIIFIICVVLILIVLYVFFIYVFFIIKHRIIYTKSRFEDEVPMTTQSDGDAAYQQLYGNSPPEMKQPKSCSGNGDMLEMCNNYNSCCSNSKNNACFCNNPLIVKCNANYNTCMNDANNIANNSKTQLNTLCSSFNSQCCDSYSNNVIDNNNFKLPTNDTQTTNILCNLSSIKNIQQKAMELCQTNPLCVSYSCLPPNPAAVSTVSSCSLYSIVSPDALKIDTTTGKRVAKTNELIYYIKK